VVLAHDPLFTKHQVEISPSTTARMLFHHVSLTSASTKCYFKHFKIPLAPQRNKSALI